MLQIARDSPFYEGEGEFLLQAGGISCLRNLTVARCGPGSS